MASLMKHKLTHKFIWEVSIEGPLLVAWGTCKTDRILTLGVHLTQDIQSSRIFLKKCNAFLLHWYITQYYFALNYHKHNCITLYKYDWKFVLELWWCFSVFYKFKNIVFHILISLNQDASFNWCLPAIKVYFCLY